MSRLILCGLGYLNSVFFFEEKDKHSEGKKKIKKISPFIETHTIKRVKAEELSNKPNLSYDNLFLIMNSDAFSII